jgi:hypothetical protein
MFAFIGVTLPLLRHHSTRQGRLMWAGRWSGSGSVVTGMEMCSVSRPIAGPFMGNSRGSESGRPLQGRIPGW